MNTADDIPPPAAEDDNAEPESEEEAVAAFLEAWRHGGNLEVARVFTARAIESNGNGRVHRATKPEPDAIPPLSKPIPVVPWAHERDRIAFEKSWIERHRLVRDGARFVEPHEWRAIDYVFGEFERHEDTLPAGVRSTVAKLDDVNAGLGIDGKLGLVLALAMFTLMLRAEP